MAWNNKDEWKRIKPLLEGEQTIVVYDLETTGLSPERDRFIENAAIKYKYNNNIWTKLDEMSFLVNPLVPLSEKIVEITGITNQDLVDKATEDALFPTIESFFADCIVAGYNNTRFDNLFMTEYFARNGDNFKPAGNIDGYLLAKQSGLYTQLKDCKLSTLAEYYGLDFTAHRALGDVQTTAETLRIMISEYQDMEKAACACVRKINAVVNRISFWEGFKGFSRIYVETSAGTVYYDLRSTLWGGKDVDVDILNMENIQEQALTITQCPDMVEFAKFRSSVKR